MHNYSCYIATCTNIYTHIATCTHAAPTHTASYMRMNIYTCMTHADTISTHVNTVTYKCLYIVRTTAIVLSDPPGSVS